MGGACVLVYCPKKILVSRTWPVLWLSVGSGGPSPGGLGRSHRGGRSLSHLALDLRRSAVSGFPLSMETTHQVPQVPQSPLPEHSASTPLEFTLCKLFQDTPNQTEENSLVLSFTSSPANGSRLHKSRIMTQLRKTDLSSFLLQLQTTTACEVSIRIKEFRKLITSGAGVKNMNCRDFLGGPVTATVCF